MKTKLLMVLALILCSAVLMMQFMAPAVNAEKFSYLDIVAAAAHYMIKPGQPGYNATIVAEYDFAKVGYINLMDLVTMLVNYSKPLH